MFIQHSLSSTISLSPVTLPSHSLWFSWEFHTCKQCILIKSITVLSPPMLSQIPPQLSPNCMCSFSLFRILRVHLVQPVVYSVVYSELFRGHIPEENLLSLPSGHQLSIVSQLWVGTLWVPLQSACILVWLTLCRSSACSHSCCEFMFAVTPSRPADTVSGQTPTASGPYVISAFSFSLIPEHWRERVWMK